jgi:hypothetical protein
VYFHHHHHHHHHQGLDPLIRSVSRVTTVLANVSSVFQLFFFLTVCSDMISKGFGLVARLFSLNLNSLSSFSPWLSFVNQSCASSGDSKLGGVSSGWITSPSMSKFGGGFQTCN